jgi:hypothetical protein
MANLLEKYQRQIKVAEAYVANNFEGKKVSENTKLNTAVLIDNTNRFMTMMESMNTQATERSNLGDWKKFCLNLTNIAVPSLIANDLVIVHAMTSFSGSVAYLEYQSRTNKGDVKRGDVFNSVFGLGDMTEARQNFTAELIIDTMVESGSGISGLSATPIEGAIVDPEGNAHTFKVVRGADTFYADVYEPVLGDKVIYKSEEFQMTHVPAQDIPTIGPVMKRIPLVAEPRRIAVRYDQITAFQAKTDYGFNLDKQIAEQAVGELNYEIDTEMVDLLYQAAKSATTEDELKALTWNKAKPLGVSKFEHYNGFLEIFSKAKTFIYKRTKKFHPNYMVCAADVLNVLEFVNGYKAANTTKMYGPYKAGELNGVNVYVSPLLADGEFFFGLNGSDMMSSVAVYAPYMAIVPTQLLGTPDGGLAQGFSTWYAKALLNKNLLVAGHIDGGFKDEYNKIEVKGN